MPPTVHTNSRQERSKNTDRRSDLVSRVKFNNNLPDVPFDAKSLIYPFDTSRYIHYKSTSLERNHKFDLWTEHDLGITIDLINTDAHQINPNVKLDQKDELLLEEELNANIDSKRSMSHRKNVSWLRKTEYISTEYTRAVGSTQKAESRVGFNINKKVTDEILYKDRDSQIKAINATFEAASTPLTKHHSRPNVTPVEVFPVFPDFEMWKHPCAQVIFDTDPSPGGKPLAEQKEEISQAIICGEQFVTYFLPTQETLKKRKRDAEIGVDYDEDDEYDYMLAREYNWTVKNRSPNDCAENYFLVFRENGVFYNELETRVRLSKRRKIGQSGQPATRSRLVLRHRPFTAEELTQQNERASILEPFADEDEEVDQFPKEDNEGNAAEEVHSEQEQDISKDVDQESHKDGRSSNSSGSSDEADSDDDKEKIFGNDSD